MSKEILRGSARPGNKPSTMVDSIDAIVKAGLAKARRSFAKLYSRTDPVASGFIDMIGDEFEREGFYLACERVLSIELSKSPYEQDKIAIAMATSVMHQMACRGYRFVRPGAGLNGAADDLE